MTWHKEDRSMKLYKLKLWLSRYLPLLVLIFTFVLAFVFIYFDVVENTGDKIAGIITILGLGFAVFQYLKSKSGLKHQAFYELREIVESIPEILNTALMEPEINLYHLISDLMTRYNKFNSTTHYAEESVFPHLKYSGSRQKIAGLTHEILTKTMDFKNKIVAIQEDKNLALMGIDVMERHNWQNFVKAKLHDLHKRKVEFYRETVKYI